MSSFKFRRVAAIAVLAVTVVGQGALSACGGDTDGQARLTTSSTRAPDLQLPGLDSSATDEGTRTPSADARAAAAVLFEAWKDEDRDAALAVASPAAVDELFAAGVPRPAPTFDTCYLSGEGTTDCQYEYENGTLVVRVVQADDGALRVEDVGLTTF